MTDTERDLTQKVLSLKICVSNLLIGKMVQLKNGGWHTINYTVGAVLVDKDDFRFHIEDIVDFYNEE